MSEQTLVDAARLAEHLQDPEWLVFDLRFSLTDQDYGRRAYAAGHVPGARFLDVEEDLSGPVTPATGRHPLPDAAQLEERLGALLDHRHGHRHLLKGHGEYREPPGRSTEVARS